MSCYAAMLALKKWRIITLLRTTSVVDVDLRIAGNGIEGQEVGFVLTFYCKIILKTTLFFFLVFHLKSWLRAEMSQPLEASEKDVKVLFIWWQYYLNQLTCSMGSTSFPRGSIPCRSYVSIPLWRPLGRPSVKGRSPRKSLIQKKSNKL